MNRFSWDPARLLINAQEDIVTRIVVSLLLSVVLSACFSIQLSAQVGPIQQAPVPKGPFQKGPPTPIQQPSVQQTQSPPNPVRDAQALTIIQAAITALGGATAIGQIQSWLIQAEVQSSQEMGSTSSGLLWEKAGTEFRMASTPTASGQTSSIMTGHGNPVSVSNGTSNAVPAHVMSALFIPALVGSVLLTEFQDPNYSVQYSGSSTLNGKPVAVARTASTSSRTNFQVTGQTWYFDGVTGLPLRIEYTVPTANTPQISSTVAIDLSDYRPVAGTLYPFQIVESEQRKQLQTITIQSVNVNATISPSDFDPPAGGAL
jgi:hypothetical protein